MSRDSWERVRELFEAALDRPTEERVAFVRSHEQDERVVQEVLSLLSSHDSEDGALESLAEDELVGSLEKVLAEDLENVQVGRFRIRRVLARGGMGTVYEATQESPSRTVALKMLRFGLGSRRARRRFRYESEILAHLRHQAIAQVYEAGTHPTKSGNIPYFAMELVEGALTIREYALRHELSLAHVVDLFLEVCDAVQYGHQSGIIHRDLKPGNILVGRDGQPKVIDFGIARAEFESGASMDTETGQVLGTPRYMSPEQLDGHPHRVDIRSDVYSLGVILYELCVFELPYPLAKKPPLTVARIIRDQPPTRPTSVHSSFPQDLEWVLLKALEKDPDRRYRTVADLAQDLARFRRGDAVQASPPSLLYRCRKLVSRHRLASVLTLGVVLALVTSFTALWLGFVEARTAREDAERERTHAGLEAQKARAVSEFLGSLLSGSPREQGREVKVRDLVERAAQMVDGQTHSNPLVRASLERTIGLTYHQLGHFRDAERHLRHALELRRNHPSPSSRELFESWLELGALLLDATRLPESGQCLDHAQRLGEQLFAEDDSRLQQVSFQKALLYRRSGRLDDAEVLYRALLDSNPQVDAVTFIHLHSLEELAELRIERGDPQEAEFLLQSALSHSRNRLGEEAPGTLDLIEKIASLRTRLGRHEEASALLHQVWQRRSQALGRDHVDTVRCLNALAKSWRRSGESPRSMLLLEQALAGLSEDLTDSHPLTLETSLTLVLAYRDAHRLIEAELLCHRTHDLARTALGRGHPIAQAAREYLQILRGAMEKERIEHDGG